MGPYISLTLTTPDALFPHTSGSLALWRWHSFKDAESFKNAIKIKTG
jgi:hypothetical protein